MKSSDASRNSDAGLSAGQMALGVFGLVAPVVTFLLAISSLPDSVKIAILIVLAASYSVVCLWAFRKSTQAVEPVDQETAEDPELAQALSSIGEAGEFFGASLKPSDVFRLVSNRVEQVFPFSTSALFIESESGESLQVVQADGQNSRAMLSTILPVDSGVAGLAWLSREVEIDSDLALETAAMPDEAIAGL